MKRRNKKTKYKSKTSFKKKFKKYKKTLRNKNKKIKKSMKGGMKSMDDEAIPLDIHMSNAIMYVIKPGDEPIPIDPRPIDKINHVMTLIEKFKEMIDSGRKYNLYISIGSNCLHYIDEEEKLNKCIEGQIIIPEGWMEPDCITKVFIIDYDSIRMKEEILESQGYNIDDYEFFNIFWLDDVEELNFIFKRYVEYNISNNGKILCINYAKYKTRQPCQFPNLINILYGVDKPPYIDNEGHKDIIYSRRAFYLDHIYRTGTEESETSVELFYHHLAKQIPMENRIKIDNINNLTKAKTPNQVYFSTDKIIF